jgi:hypothetical protein
MEGVAEESNAFNSFTDGGALNMGEGNKIRSTSPSLLRAALFHRVVCVSYFRDDVETSILLLSASSPRREIGISDEMTSPQDIGSRVGGTMN